MSLAADQDSRSFRVSIGLWVGLAVVMAVALLTSARERTVLHAYRYGSERWLASEPLYSSSGHGFLYFPQAAILFVPWAALPYWSGELLWRVFNLATLAAGTYVFCQALKPRDGIKLWPVMSLATIILAWASVRTGQTTILMTALMLFAMTDLIKERWTRAAAWLWLAFAFKPIVLPLLLLVPVLWPRTMAVRMIVGGVVTAVMPFFFQRPDYVLEQYRLLPTMLQSAASLGHKEWFTHLFGMIAAFGVHVPDPIPSLLRAGFAVATLIAAFVMKRKLPARDFGLFLGSLVACYILLFNPRTESNTYALVGPFLGLYLAMRWNEQRYRDASLLITFAVMMVGTYELGKSFLDGHGNHVLAPLATILFSGWLLWDAIRGTRFPTCVSRSSGGDTLTSDTLENVSHAKPRHAA